MVSFNDFKKKFAQANNEIPQATVVLPSNGKRANIRQMKVREQKELLKAFEKQDEYLINEAFDKILSTCVIDIDGVTYDNDIVCVQDRQFLLIKVRQLSSGDKIKVPHYIKKTEKTEQVEVDLSQLKVVTHEGDINKEIQLNDTTKIILGPVTRKNEKDIEKYLKSKADAKNSIIERRYCVYAALIKEILDDGVKIDASFENILDFVTAFCSEKVLKEIEEYASSLNFGIILNFPVAVDGYENAEEEGYLLSFFML